MFNNFCFTRTGRTCYAKILFALGEKDGDGRGVVLYVIGVWFFGW
jgi:hypothetical protein